VSNNVAGDTGGGIWISGTTMTINGCTFSDNVEDGSGFGAYVPSTGNDISNGGLAKTLTIKESVFTNNTAWSFSPIVGPWTNKGGNIFS
jgi:hypothetical protein